MSSATPPLAGRVIAITGATGGIGRALALAAARDGAQLVLLGRNLLKLQGLRAEIEQFAPGQALMAPMDLETAVANDYDNLAAAVLAKYGRLDGLVHCAGLLGALTPIDQYDVPTWCKVLHVDLTAPFILTQVLMPVMRKSESASIVFVSSSVARHAKAYWGAYSVAKAGLENLSAMLAIEVEAEGRLRVNSVNPGALRTPMRAAAYPAERPDGVTEPAAVAPLFLYLLGADSRGVNGQHFDAQ